MIMWIAAIVLVALTIGVGYRQGATRAAFSLVGLLAGAILAVPLGSMFYWVFPFIGFKNPMAGKFGGPIIAFFVVSFVFKAIGSFVHRKVDYYYRYQRDDATRAVWEVMHRRVGACVGALNGTVYFVAFALIVAVFGYFTIQTGAANSESKVLSFLGKSAEDLQSTGMDKAVAPFNPASEKYFEFSDIAGLLFHNRTLVDRLYNYPVFAAMAEEPTYRELGADKELQGMIKGQASLNDILANEKVAAVVSNSDVATRVLELDFKDLRQYLETGNSEKYAQEKILGRWSYDELSTLQLNKKLKPDVLASVWSRMKNEYMERFDNSVFTAFYDNKAKFVLATNMDGRATPYQPVPMRGTRPGATPGAAPIAVTVTNFVPRWFITNATFSAVGKWSGTAPNYFVSLGNRNGTATSEGKLQGDQLAFGFEGRALVFRRIPD
jgi:hypothetical protein